MRAAILAGLCLALQATAANAEVELKNDGFTGEGMVPVQIGFGAGDIAAARFVAPDAGRTLLKVQLLFAGATTTRTITLRVWDDPGSTSPGTQLYFNNFQLMGSDSAMQEIVTTDMPVTVQTQFRVGLEFGDGCPPAPDACGPPSIANDNDGTVAQDKNFIFASNLGGWLRSSDAGVQGDWIIRAFVSGTSTGGGDAGTPVGGPCTSNPECPTGQFCDTQAGACTFECRLDEDCGGGACNSLGQCVGGNDGGGCCQAERGGDIGTLLLCLVIFGVVRTSRRGRNRERHVARNG